jgi:hypothetical protein
LYGLAEKNFGIARDISNGSNGNATIFGIPGYNAGFFYDNCSGWGSIWGESCASKLLLHPTQTGTPGQLWWSFGNCSNCHRKGFLGFIERRNGLPRPGKSNQRFYRRQLCF